MESTGSLIIVFVSAFILNEAVLVDIQPHNTSAVYEATDWVDFDFSVTLTGPGPQCYVNITIWGEYFQTIVVNETIDENSYDWQISSCANIYSKEDFPSQWSVSGDHDVLINFERIDEICDPTISGTVILQISDLAVMGTFIEIEMGVSYNYDCASTTPSHTVSIASAGVYTKSPSVTLSALRHPENNVFALVGDLTKFLLKVSFPKGVVSTSTISYMIDDLNPSVTRPTILNFKWFNVAWGRNLKCFQNGSASVDSLVTNCGKLYESEYYGMNITHHEDGLRLRVGGFVSMPEMKVIGGHIDHKNNEFRSYFKTRLISNPNSIFPLNVGKSHSVSVGYYYGLQSWSETIDVFVNGTRNSTGIPVLITIRADMRAISDGNAKLWVEVGHDDRSTADASNVTLTIISTPLFPFNSVTFYEGTIDEVRVSILSPTETKIDIGPLFLDYVFNAEFLLSAQLTLGPSQVYKFAGAVQVSYTDKDGVNFTHTNLKQMTRTYAEEVPCGTDDWVFFQGYCYLFNDSMVTHSQATSVCSKHGSYLTSIHSREENHFVERFNSLSVDSHFIWIGLNDLQTGANSWMDRSAVDYEAFPNNEHEVPGCGAIALNSFADVRTNEGATARYWYNNDCSKLGGFVCKKKPVICPTDWIPLFSKCYYISDFKSNYTAAVDSCDTEYGHLVTFNTLQEFLQLRSLLITTWHFYIGLVENMETGTFEWVDGSLYLESSPWLPTVTMTPSATCVAIVSDLLVEVDCTSEQYFICEQDTERPPVVHSSTTLQWVDQTIEHVCQCYHDASLFNCPCCEQGGCQCVNDEHNTCVRCGNRRSCAVDEYRDYDHVLNMFAGSMITCGTSLISKEGRGQHTCFLGSQTESSHRWSGFGSGTANVISSDVTQSLIYGIHSSRQAYTISNVQSPRKTYSIPLSDWMAGKDSATTTVGYSTENVMTSCCEHEV